MRIDRAAGLGQPPSKVDATAEHDGVIAVGIDL